jgi:hypothetical protein
MPFPCHAYQVFIASPSDVPEERDAVTAAIHQWNALNATQRSAVLLPIRWETHAAPELGDRPQGIINKRILRDCDLLIAVFGCRIGTPTGRAESGTVEEIEEADKGGKVVLLYFSNKPVPPASIDPAQLANLVDFRGKYARRGLVWEFGDPHGLSDLVSRHLTLTMQRMFAPIRQSKQGSHQAAGPGQSTDGGNTAVPADADSVVGAVSAPDFAPDAPHRTTTGRDRIEPGSGTSTVLYYCPTPFCPMNSPFTTSGRVMFSPRFVGSAPDAELCCRFCGSTMVSCCLSCGRSLDADSCVCPDCGEHYVSTVALDEESSARLGNVPELPKIPGAEGPRPFWSPRRRV